MKLLPYALALVVLAVPVLIGIRLLTTRSSGLPEVWIRAGDARIRTELAIGVLAKARGLSYRDELEEGRGMMFPFGGASARSFWMLGMRFPIDIVWIREGLVIGIASDVQPQQGSPSWQLRTYESPGPADDVLELPAGYAAAHGIAEGSRVIVEGR